MGDTNWTEQDRLDDDRARSQSASRLGTGLNPFTVRGRCATCPGKLYSDSEVASGVCVGCACAAERDCKAGHPLARTTESGWLLLSAHPTKYQEPLYDGGERLAFRTCVHCRSTLSRVVAAEGRAA